MYSDVYIIDVLYIFKSIKTLRYVCFLTPVIFRQSSYLIPVICHIFSAQKAFMILVRNYPFRQVTTRSWFDTGQQISVKVMNGCIVLMVYGEQ